MLLGVGKEEKDMIETSFLVSPISSNYSAVPTTGHYHSTLGGNNDKAEAPSCLNTTSTFELGSSAQKNATLASTDKGGGEPANLLSGMYEEKSIMAMKNATTIEERPVGCSNISSLNVSSIRYCTALLYTTTSNGCPFDVVSCTTSTCC